MISHCFVRTNNVIVCKCHMVTYVNKISDGDIVVGESEMDCIEANCVLMSEDKVIDDNLLRIEYSKRAKGVKVGYIEIGYNEYILIRSYHELKKRIFFCLLSVIFILDLFMFWRWCL